MKYFFLFVSVFSIFNSISYAFFVRPKATYITGPNGYQKHAYALDFGGRLHLRSEASFQSSDFSTGESKRYGAFLGYDLKKWGISGGGGFSPEKNGYKYEYAEADAWTSFPLLGRNEASPKPQIELELGIGGRWTRHHDSRILSTGVGALSGAALGVLDKGRGGGGNDRGGDDDGIVDIVTSPRGSSLDFLQTDVTGSAAFTFFDAVALSYDMTASSYDKDLRAENVRSVELTGDVGTLLTGYPELSQTARIEFLFPYVTPYASMNRTRFKTGEEDASSLKFGGITTVSKIRLEAALERLKPFPDAKTENYTTLAAAIRF